MRDKGDIVVPVMTAHSPLFLLECLLEIPTNRSLLTGRIKQKSCGITTLFNRPVKQVTHLPPGCFSHLCPLAILWVNFGTLPAVSGRSHPVCRRPPLCCREFITLLCACTCRRTQFGWTRRPLSPTPTGQTICVLYLFASVQIL